MESQYHFVDPSLDLFPSQVSCLAFTTVDGLNLSEFLLITFQASHSSFFASSWLQCHKPFKANPCLLLKLSFSILILLYFFQIV